MPVRKGAADRPKALARYGGGTRLVRSQPGRDRDAVAVREVRPAAQAHGAG